MGCFFDYFFGCIIGVCCKSLIGLKDDFFGIGDYYFFLWFESGGGDVEVGFGLFVGGNVCGVGEDVGLVI